MNIETSESCIAQH